MNKAFLYFLTISLGSAMFSSCSAGHRSFSEPEAFHAAYTQNDFTQQKQCFQSHCFEAQVQTPSFILARESAQGVLKTEAQASERAQNLENQLFFILKLEKEDGSKLAENLPKLQKQQVYLQQNGQQIPCAFLYDETVPGLHNGRSLHLVFDLEQGLEPNDFMLLIDHPSLGIAQFKYNLKSIQDLPTFIFNSSES